MCTGGHGSTLENLAGGNWIEELHNPQVTLTKISSINKVVSDVLGSRDNTSAWSLSLPLIWLPETLSS